jgi:hypothetical protein
MSVCDDAAGLRGAGPFYLDGGMADAGPGSVLDNAAQSSARVLCR